MTLEQLDYLAERQREAVGGKPTLLSDALIIGAQAMRDLSALRQELRETAGVVKAARKLKFGVYPAHGSGWVTIVIEGDVDELAKSLAALSSPEARK